MTTIRAVLLDFGHTLVNYEADEAALLHSYRDIHAFLVNDVNRRADDPDSPIVATELVTTSVSSGARPQADFDRWLPENPNVRLARSDYRGYLRLAVDAERLHAELVAVDDVARADSRTHVLATFDVVAGRAGVAR